MVTWAAAEAAMRISGHAVVKQRTFHLAHGIGIVSAVQQCLQTVGVVGDVHNVPFLVVYEQQSLL